MTVRDVEVVGAWSKDGFGITIVTDILLEMSQEGVASAILLATRNFTKGRRSVESVSF